MSLFDLNLFRKSIFCLTFTLLASATGNSIAVSTLQERFRNVSCWHVITFDKKTGRMTGPWKAELDNLASYVKFDKASKFGASFQVASYEEFNNEERKLQRDEVAKELEKRGMNVGRIDFYIFEPTSITKFQTQFLPFVIVGASYRFPEQDVREAPKCVPSYAWPVAR